MTADALWYFGYGSNMSRATFYGRRKMQPLEARPARVADYELRFNLPVGPGERAVANLERLPGALTWGILYLLTPVELDRLDRTEGVHLGVYRRTEVEAVVGEAQRVAAFTYCSSHTTDGRKPSPRYMGLLLDGAHEHGLPEDYVRYLESFELAVDEREVAAAGKQA